MSSEFLTSWNGEASTLERVLMRSSQKLSRRSVIRRTSKLVLGIVGISVAYRVTTPIREVEAGSHCGSWCYWCGVCGKRCDLCGGSMTTCPAGTSQGAGYWSTCCDITCGVRRYYDCCSTGATCSATKCWNNCPQDTWCPGGSYTTYYCSLSKWAASGPC